MTALRRGVAVLYRGSRRRPPPGARASCVAGIMPWIVTSTGRRPRMAGPRSGVSADPWRAAAWRRCGGPSRSVWGGSRVSPARRRTVRSGSRARMPGPVFGRRACQGRACQGRACQDRRFRIREPEGPGDPDDGLRHDRDPTRVRDRIVRHRSRPYAPRASRVGVGSRERVVTCEGVPSCGWGSDAAGQADAASVAGRGGGRCGTGMSATPSAPSIIRSMVRKPGRRPPRSPARIDRTASRTSSGPSRRLASRAAKVTSWSRVSAGSSGGGQRLGSGSLGPLVVFAVSTRAIHDMSKGIWKQGHGHAAADERSRSGRSASFRSCRRLRRSLTSPACSTSSTTTGTLAQAVRRTVCTGLPGPAVDEPRCEPAMAKPAGSPVASIAQTGRPTASASRRVHRGLPMPGRPDERHRREPQPEAPLADGRPHGAPDDLRGGRHPRHAVVRRGGDLVGAVPGRNGDGTAMAVAPSRRTAGFRRSSCADARGRSPP